MTLVATIVVPTVSVIATATVAIWSKLIDASTKREDRDHERALDYEQRVWQAKNDALKRLISACRFVKSEAQLNTPHENRRRAVSVQALHGFRDRIGGEDGITEIMAYAAEPVCEALDAMLDQVKTQSQRHENELRNLKGIEPLLDRRVEVPTVLPEGMSESSVLEEIMEELEERKSLVRNQQMNLEKIGSESDLDLDALIALCDGVIDVARKDLQGRYGLPGKA
jgi:hypothetical protein